MAGFPRSHINPWLTASARGFSHSALQLRVGMARSMEDCAAAWRMFERDAACTVFQTHAWMETWQRTVGAARGSEPRIALVRDGDGQLVMILPLALERVLGVPTLVWMAAEEADYHGPLVLPGFAATCDQAKVGKILHQVAELVPEANAISLVKTVASIGDVPNPIAFAPHAPHPSGAHAISLQCGFDALYEARVSKKSRRKDRRRRNRLESIGETRLVVAQHPAQQHDMLNLILMQKAKWLADRGIADPFEAPHVQDFLHGLIDNPQTRPSLHIAALLTGTDAVAGGFGYLHDGRYYAVIGSITTDEELARCAPGTLLLHEKLRWCEANGVTTFDLTIGDEPYKAEWCDQYLELVDIRLPLSISGYLALLPVQAHAALKRAIKRSPRLLAIASDARRIIRRMWPA